MKKHIILKKLVAITLAAITAASAFGMSASAASVADFTDVKPGAWYYPAVEYATDNQLFQGTTPTTFSPNGSVTRGMFVTVLGRKAGVNIKDYPTTRFKDVKSSIYYAPYVEWAATYGIVNGTDEKKALFSPDKTVTREQMASILYRFAQATENDVDYSGEKFYSFSDYGKVSSFAQDAFKWASDKGIINGSDGKLNPKGTATRAQVAQVFLSAQYVLTKTEITIDPIPAPEPDADPKADPNNIFNVYKRDFSAKNDWQVSSKSKMDPSEQAQLISLLKGKTGNMVWNEIALHGMTTGNVGCTYDATYWGLGTIYDESQIEESDYYEVEMKATTVDQVAATILKRLPDVPDAKYICVDVTDHVDAKGNKLEGLFYEIYFINTPEAVVEPSDSAFTAKVKRLVAERLPSGYVLDNSLAPDGGWSDFVFMPGHLSLSEDKLAEEYADFFVYLIRNNWHMGGEYDAECGKWVYDIALAPGLDPKTGNNGHEPLRMYYA